MKKLIKVILVSIVFAGFLSATACSNTWSGIGKDIEDMGKDMQE
ncbi:hypothetical protein MNBD_GAMMA11-181 [hydrothermal vent metagenome]|uniref:Entericidin EcnAB n=1 Tax=hydrothermal vent metagenome TaxID=652676 RepID=A0A3B0XA75_9ZZZZ